MGRTAAALACVALLSALAAPTASAQERILFPAIKAPEHDAEAEILRKIDAEQTRVDIGVWYLQDHGITMALIDKFVNKRVPVRVLGDWLPVFTIDPVTREKFEMLANAGIPIRLRYHPNWFPEAMHWKCGIFRGQGIVEFGSANWTPFELTAWSTSDFKDETAMVTNDPTIVNGFLTQFDRMWADTTYFLDWPEVYQLATGNPWTKPMNISRARLEGDFASPPGMIWSQGPELNNAMAAAIDAEPSNGQVDLVIYRLSDPVITDAAIRKLQAGARVRVIVEPGQYHEPTWPEYWLTGAQVDRLWVAGAQIKQRAHQGLTHMKTLITSAVGLNGSSNFTRNWQRDHNYFISATGKPALYQSLKDRFNAMMNDNVNYITFQPLAAEAPTLVAPAAGASGVSTTPKLEWNRSRWAVAFDVYLSQSGGPFVLQTPVPVSATLSESPPETYSWTPSQPLQSNTTYTWKIVARTFATELRPTLVNESQTRTFSTGGSGGGTPPPQTPFGGTPVSLPGTIQAENFDEGGQNVAYFDASPGNTGGVYRNPTDVDIAAAEDTGGGFTVGWAGASEWLEYTVNVPTAGTYTINVRVASGGAGGTFRVESNGADKTGTMTVPSTGGWQTWQTVSKTGVSLSAGQQVLRLVLVTNGPTGAVGNFNWISVTSGGTPPPPPPEICGNGIDDDGDGLIDEGCTPAGSTPFGGTPASLPGTLQAENFDNGGQNVAYFDHSVANEGGEYRPTERVDIAVAADGGGGYTLGWVGGGEWLKYTVNVTTAGTYDLEFRVASAGQGGTFRLEVNDVDKTGSITVPNTGDWQGWQTIRKTGVALSAGQQVWKLVMVTNGPTGAVGNFNWIGVVAGGTSPPPPPTEICGNGLDDDGDGLIDEGCTPAAPEIVIYGADVPVANLKGNWARTNDSTAAAGIRLASSNLGAPTLDVPLASPTHYFDVTFNAQAGVRYRLWLRMRAESNNKFNDSVYVQFTNSVTAGGSPQYRIGTTQALNVNLAVTSSGGLSGWGWQNSAYWLSDTGEIRFATSGTQTIRIQIREDGVSIDQIILSPSRYLNSAPGPLTNDTTIVPKS